MQPAPPQNSHMLRDLGIFAAGVAAMVLWGDLVSIDDLCAAAALLVRAARFADSCGSFCGPQGASGFLATRGYCGRS